MSLSDLLGVDLIAALDESWRRNDLRVYPDQKGLTILSHQWIACEIVRQLVRDCNEMADDVIVVHVRGGLDNMVHVQAHACRTGRRLARLLYPLRLFEQRTKKGKLEAIADAVEPGAVLRARLSYIRELGQ